MATINRTVPGYEPEDNPFYVVPVQQGSVQNLCIDVTPERHGVFGWVDLTANEYRCAIVPVLEDCFTDDVVPPGDVRTVWSAPTDRSIYTGVLSVIDGELIAFISHYYTPGAPPNGTLECWVADDVENPVTWTLRSTISNTSNSGGTVLDEVRQAGPPTITDDGVWLLPMHAFIQFAGTAMEDAVGLYYSDDQGATWTRRIAFRTSPLQSAAAGPQSTTIAQDPVTGDYWFGTHIGPSTQWRHYSATSSTGTWSASALTGNIDPHYYLDDGVNVYAGRVHDGAMNLYIVGDPTDFSTWTDLEMRGIVSDTITEQEGFQIIPLVWNEITYLGIAFTAKDRIVFNPVNSIILPPPLWIPFKDRLFGVIELPEIDSPGKDHPWI